MDEVTSMAVYDYEPEGLGVGIIVKELEGALRFAEDEMRNAWDNRNIAGAYLKVAADVKNAATFALERAPTSENEKQTKEFVNNMKGMEYEFTQAEMEWDYWYKMYEILELQVKFWKAEQDRDSRGQEKISEKLIEIWDTTTEEGVDNDDKAD